MELDGPSRTKSRCFLNAFSDGFQIIWTKMLANGLTDSRNKFKVIFCFLRSTVTI